MRAASLFSGYGGLTLGVHEALRQVGYDPELVFVSDIEPGPKRILAHRFPAVPNLGDITEIDWHQVAETLGPIDVLDGGSPCQDLSTAGRRAGMVPGTRSGLWESMVHAVGVLQPQLVIWENVHGALSAPAYSNMECRPGCVGGEPGGVILRAPGRVLGDLASLGYDARWQVVSAASVGAPHLRNRIFIVAYPHDDGLGGFSGRTRGRSQEVTTTIGDQPLLPTPTVGDKGGTEARSGEGFGAPLGQIVRLFSTPDTVPDAPNTGSNSHKAGNIVGLGNQVRALLSTPIARDHKGVPQRGFNVASLPRDVALLPTPKANDGDFGLPRTSGRPPEKSTHLATRLAYTDWGDYAPAVHRWEQVLGRPAPSPTQPSKTGKAQLSPAFVEWMMGLPAGWVTDVHISRANQLRALGNGVVPQQATSAVLSLLSTQEQGQERAA